MNLLRMLQEHELEAAVEDLNELEDIMEKISIELRNQLRTRIQTSIHRWE